MNFRTMFVLMGVLAAVLLPGALLPFAAFPFCIMFVIVDPTTIFVFRRKVYWLAFVLLVLLQPLLLGVKDTLLGGFIPYSSNLLILGGVMMLRATVLMFGFSILFKKISHNHLTSLCQRFGLQGFDEVYREAERSIPAVRNQAVSLLKNHKQRLLYHPIDLLARTLASLLRQAEQTRENPLQKGNP